MTARVIFLLLVQLAWAAQAVAQQLEVSETQQELLGIEVQAVASAATGSLGELTLRVGFSPDGEWAITTPFPGILHRAWVRVGDRVKAGDPLMTVRSAEVVSLQREYLKVRAELSLRVAAWTRDKKLSDAGSVSNRRWQETRFAHDMAKAEFAGLRAQLSLAGFSDEDLKQLAQNMDISPDITMRAPADAIVLDRPAMLGDHLDGSELSAAAHLEEGMGVVMQGSDHRAVIVLVSNVIDPNTQTVQVRAEPLEFAGLVPGQLTRWSVQSSSDLLTVPSSAIVKLDGVDVAYVQITDGFEPRAVDVRSTGSGNWIVLAGLNPGDRVAISGTAVLKGMSVGMGGGDQ